MGTKAYLASELVYLQKGQPEQNPATTWDKVDVFSLGVLIFVLRFGNLPFHSATVSDSDYSAFIYQNEEFYKRHPFTADQMREGKISKDFRQLLQSMLWPSPKNRPSVEMLLAKSAWLNQQDGVVSREELSEFFSAPEKRKF